MTEPFNFAKNIESAVSPESFDFKTTVDINGLPYIFSCPVPPERKGFDWQLVIPDMENYSMTRGVSNFFDIWDNEFGFCWTGKAIGILKVSVDPQKPGLHLAELRSKAALLSSTLPYHRASGIGNFLLQNLITLSEIKGEPIYLTVAPDIDGKLTLEQVTAWYERNGFEHITSRRQEDINKMVRNV